jgi:hypothetical protein
MSAFYIALSSSALGFRDEWLCDKTSSAWLEIGVIHLSDCSVVGTPTSYKPISGQPSTPILPV